MSIRNRYPDYESAISVLEKLEQEGHKVWPESEKSAGALTSTPPQSETRLSVLYREELDKSSAVFLADATGRFVDVNENMLTLTGYSREELIGKPVSLLNSGHHPKAFFRDFWETIKSGKRWEGVICNLHKSRQRYWINMVVLSLEQSDPRGGRYLAVSHDITTTMRSQLFLEQAEVLGGLGYLSIDLTNGEQWWSAGTYRIHGLSQEEKAPNINAFIERCVFKEDRSLVAKMLGNPGTQEASHRELRFEHRIINSEGETRWVRVIGSWLGGNPKSGQRVAVVMDITEEREAQGALQRAEEAGHFGYIRYQPQADTMWWSRGVFLIHGLDPLRDATPSFKEVLARYIPAEDHTRIQAEFQKTEKQEKHVFEHGLIRKDGSRGIVRLAAKPAIQAGHLVEVSLMMQDISREKELEEHLQRSQRLDAASRLAAGLAHDVNNLLMGMRGPIESILDRGDVPSTDKPGLGAIQSKRSPPAR